MPVGENNFDRLAKSALRWRPESAERTAWMQVFFSLLTQASSLAAFPSYNVVLGLWGLYSVYTKSLQSTQVYLGLLCFSILLDIIFCSIWGSNDAGIFDGSTASFCLVMLILNMLAKLAAVYCFLRFYKEMESGAIRPQERLGAPAKQGGRQSAGGRGAYDMAPMSTHEERAPVGSPDASLMSSGSAASFALSPKGRAD
ncbi:hypothetical protein Esi_0231_0003 [Ectocarpus siliculosus]|uniref:Uncharacterized protein n=1 Tax=Ectocarpus siliculosus TaxID=2880 RepID=D7FSB1_ECTSI|nr:hypothetical protein Esi_0231_0003 [Ectocarpus siliculosus]|eukprot:CBJ31052.1 hypothetical protein Esi_0231_0003 [Ectocarpus siliculosus]